MIEGFGLDLERDLMEYRDLILFLKFHVDKRISLLAKTFPMAPPCQWFLSSERIPWTTEDAVPTLQLAQDDHHAPSVTQVRLL